MMRPAPLKTALALAALVPLSACISFGAKPPPSLLTLTSATTLSAGQKEGNQLACDQSLVHALRQVDGAAVVPA
eukprot:gene39377-53233_t